MSKVAHRLPFRNTFQYSIALAFAPVPDLLSLLLLDSESRLLQPPEPLMNTSSPFLRHLWRRRVATTVGRISALHGGGDSGNGTYKILLLFLAHQLPAFKARPPLIRSNPTSIGKRKNRSEPSNRNLVTKNIIGYTNNQLDVISSYKSKVYSMRGKRRVRLLRISMLRKRDNRFDSRLSARFGSKAMSQTNACSSIRIPRFRRM
jgi:hypothetical protein